MLDCAAARARLQSTGGQPSDGSPVPVKFFFSSRRRHTRYWRDWSSDVCSSDLGREGWGGDEIDDGGECHLDAPLRLVGKRWRAFRRLAKPARLLEGVGQGEEFGLGRSEERRVGKECRSRGSPYH